ncbi:hypothetical protein ACP70R_005662 [Stipagrostis hirtigluma subsp. patula]
MIRFGLIAIILSFLLAIPRAHGVQEVVKVLGANGEEFLLLESIVEKQWPESTAGVVFPEGIVTKECAQCRCCIGTPNNCKNSCCYVRTCATRTTPCTFQTVACGCDHCP